MTEQEKQEGKKTLVAFVIGLLIGGMLMWAFSSSSNTANAPSKTTETTADAKSDATKGDSATKADATSTVGANTPAATLAVGEGKIVVDDQPAGATAALASAVYPVGEGWIGVREYDNDKLGYILGVVRFSESQGLVPESIVLQRPTTVGHKYAVVVFKENGDFKFNLAGDAQIDQVFDTFTAQ